MISWQSRGLLWPETVINSGGNGSDDDGDGTKELCLSHPVWEVKHVFTPQWSQSTSLSLTIVILIWSKSLHIITVIPEGPLLSFIQGSVHGINQSRWTFHSVSLADFCTELEFLPHFGFVCISDSKHSLLPPTCTILAVFVPFQFLKHPRTFLLSASTLTLFPLPGVLTLALCMVDGIPCFTPWLEAQTTCPCVLLLQIFFHFLPHIFSPTIIMNSSSGFFVIADLQF